MTAQIPAETLAAWRADAEKHNPGSDPKRDRILTLLGALAAETARAEAAEAKVARVRALINHPISKTCLTVPTANLTAALADQEDQ